MPNKIKTLVLDANGIGWRRVFADTIIQGIFNIKEDVVLPKAIEKIPILNVLGRQFSSRNEFMGYALDWSEAICSYPELDVEYCNINNLIAFNKCKEAIENYPLIIAMHAAGGSNVPLLLKKIEWFQKRKGKLVVFIGNEYELMEQKLKFLNETKTDYICTQLPEKTGKWLYQSCSNSKVIPMPHALNPKIYNSNIARKRNVDISFLGGKFPYFIGDKERSDYLMFFKEHTNKFNLNCDIRFSYLARKDWAAFLNSTKAIIGAESNSYYLDKKGYLITSAKEYCKKNPQATFDEVFNLFFKNPGIEYMSGKSISPRNFEAAGCKTGQILLEGEYNNILNPDEHYIPIKKDFSNIDEAK